MLKKSLVVASLLLIGSSLVAQDSGLYVGATYGKSTVDTGINTLTGTTSLDETDRGYKVLVGYKYNKNISVEFQYVDFGKSTVSGDAGDSYKQKDGTTVTFASNNTTYTFDGISYGLAGLYSFPVSENFIPYVKLGAHNWKTDWKTSTDTKHTGTDLFYGLGVDMPITSNISARVEYENYEADYDKSLLSVGIAYSF